MDGPFTGKKFKKLQAAWYKKLANEGFEDLEDMDQNLKASTDTRTIKNALKEKEARETYYSIARGFLENHIWANDDEHHMWELHCEGIGVRSIAHELKVTAYKVESTIGRLQKLAKLKRSA